MTGKGKLLWQITKGQRLRYLSAIAALIAASCFLYLVPLIPTAVLNGVLADADEQVSPFMAWIVDVMGGRAFVISHLWVPAAVIAALAVTAGGFTYLRGRWSAIASESIIRRLRNRLYDHLQHLPCSYHDKAETGDHVQRCTSDVETVRLFLSMQIVEIGRALVMLIVPIPLMYMLDARMTIVSLVVIPPIVAFALIFFTKVKSAFKDADEAEGKMTSTLQENLTGIRVVRAFARQDFETKKFQEKNATHRGLDYRLYYLMAWYWATSDFLCFTQKALVVCAGAYWLWQGELAVGTFYFFLSAVSMFIWPVRMMGRILTDLGKALVALGRIEEILTSQTEAQIDAQQVTEPALLPEPRRGEITFDHVRFAHGTSEDVLCDVSFRVEPGQTLALLGPSGAGKSTIIHLLLRFYDADAGTIRLDGADITQLDRMTVRRQIASVLQEPFLYSKTIGENIKIGRTTANEDETTEAAVTACLHESIEEFDKGYDTLVGERGVTLSGGQRQRVALARAILQKPAVLILDDALSAVDTETETLIIDALRKRRGRHTTIVIAHRLSTLRHADHVIVLDQGRIVQTGTHEKLVAEEGRYRRLWSIQTSLQEDFGKQLTSAAHPRTQ